jgi:phage terminase large subunit-like protein
MKKATTLMVMISILTFPFATESFAQQGMKWQGSGNWGPGTQYGRLYNAQTLESITGEVIVVDTITPIKGMSSGVHLVVKADKETISVHLGPAWYIQRQDMKIVPSDKVEITGSRITFEGKPALIAAEVKKGTEVLKLRDENGFPVWSGWRRR